MAQYPIKMLKDENGTPFVPLVAPEAVKDTQGTNWQTLIDRKLEKTNIIAGDNITLSISGNDITINSQAGGSVVNVIDNLNQSTGGVGVLDAHQGYILKGMIPGVQNTLTSTSTTDALSAYQGRLLSNRVVPGGGTTGQVLAKKSDTDNDIEWVDQTDGSSAVIISSMDNDATIIEKLLSAEENGKLVKPLFYESSGGGNENAGVYNFFQSYSDSNGKKFLFTLLLDGFYEVVFTIGGGELQNVLTKEAVMIPWQGILGDTGWLYTSLSKDELGSRGNIMSGAIYGRKIGNMVELNFATRLQGTGTTGDYTICTLKDAFKPTQNIYVQLLYGVQSHDVNTATIIKISTNGEITLDGFTLQSGIDNSNYEYHLQGNVMYFV